MLENTQSSLGVLVDLVGNHEEAVGPAVRTSDAAAKLIQLRKTEVVRAVHEHGVRVGHVESRLDDHRGHEHVHRAVHELVHDVLEITVAHLSMRDRDARTRDDSLHVVGDGFDGLDPIVHEENLSATIQLARDSFFD